MRLATCANHGKADCPICGAYAVIEPPHDGMRLMPARDCPCGYWNSADDLPVVTAEQRKAGDSRLAAAAVDYTHGRITLGELLRIAREMPR